MKAKNVLWKSGTAIAGTVPVLLATTMQPAHAMRGDLYFSADYPNCWEKIDYEHNDVPSTTSFARTQTYRCKYSSGLTGVRVKYKDANGQVVVPPISTAPIGQAAWIIVGYNLEVLASCHAAKQDGLPWGPNIEIQSAGPQDPTGWTVIIGQPCSF